MVTTTAATSTNDVTSTSRGPATANLSAAVRYIAMATHSRPPYTDRSRLCGVGRTEPHRSPVSQGKSCSFRDEPQAQPHGRNAVTPLAAFAWRLGTIVDAVAKCKSTRAAGFPPPRVAIV